MSEVMEFHQGICIRFFQKVGCATLILQSLASFATGSGNIRFTLGIAHFTTQIFTCFWGVCESLGDLFYFLQVPDCNPNFYVGCGSIAARHFISQSEAEKPAFCFSIKEIYGHISIITLDIYHPCLRLYNSFSYTVGLLSILFMAYFCFSA